MKLTKSSLAITLSRLKTFDNPSIGLEQYPTDSEVAGDILWNALLLGDIKDMKIADLGAGSGILGIGALLLGAESAEFIELDSKPIETLKENLTTLELNNYKIHNINIKEYSEKADTVIQNPPFGTKEKHADRKFLEKAFETASVVYSFHKSATREFIEKFGTKHGFTATHVFSYDFPLKATHSFHKSKIRRIQVNCIRFEKE